MDRPVKLLRTIYVQDRKQTRKTTGTPTAVLLFAAALTTSGCIGIMAKGKLEKVESFPDMSRFSRKPSVYLKTSKGAAGYHRILKRVTEQSGLFSSVTFDAAEQQEADYTIDIYESTSDPEYGFFSIVMVVGCATPYGVPVPIADTSVTLNASVEDRYGKTLGSYKIEESLTIWCGLSLLPAAPLTLVYAERLSENMIKVLYQKILDDGLLVYSP